MLRVVLAVALSTALLSVTLPALDVARHQHSEAVVRAEVEELTAVIRTVQDGQAPTPLGTPGARRVVEVRLPHRSFTDAGIDYLAIGGRSTSAGSDTNSEAEANGSHSVPAITWRIDGGRERTRRLPAVTVRHASPSGRVGDPLVLREPGTVRVAVTRAVRGNRTMVVVRRLG